MQTVDSSLMRAQNSGLILRLIWNQRRISRAEIARQTGLSRSTVSAIVNLLIEKGLVDEVGAGDSSGGRKPIILNFKDDAFGLVGVDMGAAHVGVAVTNLRGEVQCWQQQSHPVQTDPASTLGLIRQLVRTGLRETGRRNGGLLGIGVAVPSPVNRESPTELLSPIILPDWKGHDLRRSLHTAFEVPIFVDNDANLGALAELWWGAGRQGGDLAFIKLGTGVGAGLIINGEIYRGTFGMAGEIGHTVIDSSDARSLRGLRGCLSAFVGSQMLIERVAEKRREHSSSTLPEEGVTVAELVRAAVAGDTLARSIVREAGLSTGIAVANLLNLLNPRQVVLAGALTEVGDLLVEPIRQIVRERTLWESIAESRILVSQLGEQGIAVGAATQVLQAALSDHSVFPDPQPLTRVSEA